MRSVDTARAIHVPAPAYFSVELALSRQFP